MRTVQELQNKVDEIFGHDRYIIKNVYKDGKYEKCSIYCTVCEDIKERRVYHVLAGHDCKACASKRGGEKTAIPIEEKQKILDTNIKDNPLIISKTDGLKYSIYCNNCHEKWDITWSEASRYRMCPKCKSKQNLINIKRPDLIKYLVNKDDAKKYSAYSSKKIKAKCPFCGFEKNIIVANLNKQGFSCPICDTGRSFPERFVASILNGNKIKFKPQYSPPWAKGRKYDFYLPDYHIIIETHGMQHYRDSDMFQDLKHQQKNDIEKEMIARDRGCKYYIIDCFYSNIDYIENSIKKSGLIDFLNITITDEQKLRVYIDDTKKKCWELYDSGKNIKYIANIMNHDIRTIREYLKTGANLGLCTYQKYRKIAKVNIETNQIEDIFDTIKSAASKLESKPTTVARWCDQGGRLIYREKYRIIWLKDYDKYFEKGA